MGVFDRNGSFFFHKFLILFLSLLFSRFPPSSADVDSIPMPPPPSVVSPKPTPSPFRPPPLSPPPAFRPSIVVILAVLTTMFSITFLLLLYAKHYKQGVHSSFYRGNGTDPDSTAPYASSTRKNSGVDRTVIESLPIFRFSSLRGQKEGLECAVCLARFEPTEVLRLLPKCKHAFHVECVDTWLDAHSTCPLCRYRVDPEDIFLIEKNQLIKLSPSQEEPEREDSISDCKDDIESGRRSVTTECETTPRFRRISGRHSSAGERFSNLQKSAVGVGCFDRYQRKDGLMLVTTGNGARTRFQHRIVVSDGLQQRWSDVQPSDLLYLQSEMIMNDSRRSSSASNTNRMAGNAGAERRQQSQSQLTDGRSVGNSRSVSEITGFNRFSIDISNNGDLLQGEGESRFLSRWLAWISSRPHPQPVVRSERTVAVTIA